MRKMSYTTYPAPTITDVILQIGIHNRNFHLNVKQLQKQFDLGEEE